MAKFIARAVVTLALLYAGAATIFAFVHYEGAKPDVPTILTDFNAWGASLFASAEKPARPAEPPRAPPAPPAPRPIETPKPEVPVYVPTDPETRELERIEKEVLPQVEERGRKLRDMDRGNGVEFDRLRTEAMALLSEARTYLGGLLDKNPGHKQANRLWSRLQEMFAALKKL